MAEGWLKDGQLSHHEAKIHIIEAEEVLRFQNTLSVEILLTSLPPPKRKWNEIARGRQQEEEGISY